MIRIVLFGICGRMGQIVSSELQTIEDFQLVGGIEREGHPEIGKMIGNCIVSDDLHEIPEADVWLDFSLAAPAMSHVRQAVSFGKPLVLAATGFTQVDEEELHRQSKLFPLLVAPNLSAGVGTLENIAIQAAYLLPTSFDTAIVDQHHSGKLDAPSGTAKRIAERISEYRPKPQIVSIRGGGAIGEHEIRFIGTDEEIILIHRAWSRKAFSSGVERAIRFIDRQPAGYYTPQSIYTVD